MYYRNSEGYRDPTAGQALANIRRDERNRKRAHRTEKRIMIGDKSMTAKEYLNQVYRLDQKVNVKLQQLASLRSLTQRVTASYQSETVSHTRNVSSMEDSIISLMEAQEAINRQLKELVSLKSRISETISKVQNEVYCLILEKRYLCFQSWDKIAIDMGYSIRWVFTQHEHAIAAVEKLLEGNGD